MSENKVIDTTAEVKDVNPTQEAQAPAQPAAEAQAPAEVKKEGKVAWLKRQAKQHKTAIVMITAGIAGALVGVLGTKAMEKKKSENEYLPYYPEDDEDEECFDDNDDEDEDDDDEESEDDSIESELE